MNIVRMGCPNGRTLTAQRQSPNKMAKGPVYFLVQAGFLATVVKAILCLGLVTYADATTVSPSEDMSSMSVGGGFDSRSFRSRGDCVTREDSESPGGYRQRADITVVKSASEFKEFMGVSAEAAIKAAFFEFGGKAGFAESIKLDSYAVYGVVRITVLASPQVLRDVTLTATATDLLSEKYEDGFRQACGDEFVKSVTKGGELYGVIRVETETEEQRKEATTSLGGSYKLFSASVDTTKEVATALQNYRKTISVWMTGADLPLPTTLDQMIGTATQFAKSVTHNDNKNAVVVSFNTDTYDSVPAYLTNTPSNATTQLRRKIRSNRDDAVRTLSTELGSVDDRIASIEFVLDNSTMVEEFDENELRTHLGELVQFRDAELRSAAYACYNEYRDADGNEALAPGCRRVLMPDGPDLPAREPFVGFDDSTRALVEKLGRPISLDSYPDVNGWTDIHYAAVLGLENLVRYLLVSEGAGASGRDDEGVRYADLPIYDDGQEFSGGLVEILGDLGFDISSMRRHGQTPLHLAAGRGAVTTVQELIERGARVNVRDGKGLTPLHYASEALASHGSESSERVVRVLLQKTDDVSAFDTDGETFLHFAAENNLFGAASLAIQSGADVNAKAKDRDMATPLHYASEANAFDVVRVLLGERNLRVDARDDDGRTSLHLAARRRAEEVAKLLLERKANVNATDENGETPLHMARTKELAKLLIDKGASVEAKDSSGETPLHDARSLEVIQVLVRNGADANAKDRSGETRLHGARDEEVVRLLARNGAEPNLRNQDGRTPLHVAARRGRASVVSALIGVGADLRARDVRGFTPLHDTCDRTDGIEIARLLVGKGASVNASSKRGLTPLHIVAFNAADDDERDRFGGLWSYLVESGANVVAKDYLGRTPNSILRIRTEEE